MRPSSIKGRGIATRPDGRFQVRSVEFDEAAVGAAAPETRVTAVRAREILSRNRSPDIPFNASINPYQGCEHGCVYCYARPSHSYLDLSPGIDFETRIFSKPNAVERLLETWEKPGYQVEPIAIGANTDPYQPAEKRLGITRALLETFLQHRHPVSLITKGTLMLRDIDVLAELASRGLCSVAVSVPTAEDGLKRVLEPRVPAASQRFRLAGLLAEAGVPVTVMIAPVIPALNDGEIEKLVERSAEAGARQASWILLRLPHELKDLFRDWLQVHFPERAARVMSLVRQAGGGRDYDNRFGIRQRGSGQYAAMLAQRFERACRRAGIGAGGGAPRLDCSQFVRPGSRQFSLPL